MQENKKDWVFILGGSTGFGLATAHYMAAKGYSVFIVHRDRRGNIPNFMAEVEKMRSSGVRVCTVNVNALTLEGQEVIIDALKKEIKNEKIVTFLHSFADGNLKSILPDINSKGTLGQDDFLHTINAMGISFVTWSQILFQHNFFTEHSRIIGITSEGSSRVMLNYAAVGAAKSALEAFSRYMANEFAKHKITVNLLSPGVSVTPALRAFPNKEQLIHTATQKNPSGRMTLPEDVAKAVFLLSQAESSWITGNIIKVDGGEQLLS